MYLGFHREREREIERERAGAGLGPGGKERHRKRMHSVIFLERTRNIRHHVCVGVGIAQWLERRTLD